MAYRATRQTLEGAAHPDRAAQCRSINRGVKVFSAWRGSRSIAVDAKKKELVGPFAHRGRDYQTARTAGNAYGLTIFPDQQLGKICPYGGVRFNAQSGAGSGWGSINDTAQRAVEIHPTLVVADGQGGAYPQAHAVLITADGGGSNARRNRVVEGRTPKARR